MVEAFGVPNAGVIGFDGHRRIASPFLLALKGVADGRSWWVYLVAVVFESLLRGYLGRFAKLQYQRFMPTHTRLSTNKVYKFLAE